MVKLISFVHGIISFLVTTFWWNTIDDEYSRCLFRCGMGKRASRYEVVKAILDDLDTAIFNLKNTTVSSTSNDGYVTIEAAKAFKARVRLYEGTWEKYNGIGTADPTKWTV